MVGFEAERSGSVWGVGMVVMAGRHAPGTRLAGCKDEEHS